MSPLPADVEGIFDYLQVRVEGYGHLKWNEVAMMKADMMNVRRRWLGIDVAEYRARCQSAGMTRKETDEMVDYLKRTQAGKRLIPQSGYRDFRFKPEPQRPRSTTATPTTTRDW